MFDHPLSRRSLLSRTAVGFGSLALASHRSNINRLLQRQVDGLKVEFRGFHAVFDEQQFLNDRGVRKVAANGDDTGHRWG